MASERSVPQMFFAFPDITSEIHLEWDLVVRDSQGQHQESFNFLDTLVKFEQRFSTTISIKALFSDTSVFSVISTVVRRTAQNLSCLGGNNNNTLLGVLISRYLEGALLPTTLFDLNNNDSIGSRSITCSTQQLQRLNNTLASTRISFTTSLRVGQWKLELFDSLFMGPPGRFTVLSRAAELNGVDWVQVAPASNQPEVVCLTSCGVNGVCDVFLPKAEVATVTNFASFEFKTLTLTVGQPLDFVSGSNNASLTTPKGMVCRSVGVMLPKVFPPNAVEVGLRCRFVQTAECREVARAVANGTLTTLVQTASLRLAITVLPLSRVQGQVSILGAGLNDQFYFNLDQGY